MRNSDPKLAVIYILSFCLISAALFFGGAAAVLLFFPEIIPFAIPEMFYAGTLIASATAASLALLFLTTALISTIMTTLYSKFSYDVNSAVKHNKKLEEGSLHYVPASTQQIFAIMHKNSYNKSGVAITNKEYQIVPPSFTWYVIFGFFPLLNLFCPDKVLDHLISHACDNDEWSSDDEENSDNSFSM